MDRKKFLASYEEVLIKHKFEHITTSYDSAIIQIEQRKDKIIQPLKTGWDTYDATLGGGLQESTVMVIGGRPGVGKSVFSSRMLYGICEHNNLSKFVILFWNLEMRNTQQVTRFISSKTGKTVNEINSAKETLSDTDFNIIKQMKLYVNDYPFYFFNNRITPERIKLINQELRQQFPDIHIVNLFDHTRLISSQNEKTEEQKITKLIAMFHEISVSDRINSVILSQLNRDIENMNRQSNPYPVMSDLFGADSVSQFANVITILQRPELYPSVRKYLDWDKPLKNMIAAHILKNRDGDVTWIPFKHSLQHSDLVEYDSIESI
jgi:replicative DNA helicase